jgi:hypothetical protein
VEREGLILIVNTSRLRFGDAAGVVSGAEYGVEEILILRRMSVGCGTVVLRFVLGIVWVSV